MFHFCLLTSCMETVLADYNKPLIRAAFAMACGPLAWSIYVFRNSIVFHDIEHSTSVFIHLFPFLLLWSLKWGAAHGPSAARFGDMIRVCDDEIEYLEADACMETFRGLLWCDACAAPPSDFLIPPIICYLCVWAIPNYETKARSFGVVHEACKNGSN